ncbi:hypothetical protein [Moorena sp. SIO3H5]|uniref:hypothetical protein n=1 Tax=Moorena sp. SIO3H5 TaxID=2607834 RepID=UPI0013B7A004|nr:hypothetical protein [Moorena sp. SIO3H5]NEO71575.1 hypothetical protein [Moorena sp. SIO3H5]
MKPIASLKETDLLHLEQKIQQHDKKAHASAQALRTAKRKPVLLMPWQQQKIGTNNGAIIASRLIEFVPRPYYNQPGQP